jgi:dTDP-D-glucose 4,6-dehydratase
MDKTNWKKIVELYTEATKPNIDKLKEILKQEKPEGGYKTKNDIKPDTLEKLKSSLTDDELRLLMKLMKESELGRSISRSSTFLSTPLAGSRWNEHQGLNHIMNIIKNPLISKQV